MLRSSLGQMGVPGGVGESVFLAAVGSWCFHLQAYRLLACVFFHLSAWGCDKSGLWFLTLSSWGERLLSWGGVVGENEAGASCSHLLKASPGVGGSGNLRK